MANEFIIKNGFRSQGNSEITGSLNISGSINTTSPINLTGFAAGSVLFTSGSAGVITGSSNLFWDNPNTGLILGGGTLDTNYILQVNGTKGIRVSGSAAGFGFNLLRGSEQSGLANNGSAGVFTSTTTLIYQTAATERMRINANGNVLIGTSTDSSRLTVRGSGTTSATTTLRVENTNASASLTVLDNGFVGIGKNTPISTLHLGNDISGFLGDFTTPAITFNTLNNGIYLDSNRINFKTGGSFSFGADSSGPVGNGFRINAAAYNDLTTPIFVPYRLTTLGLLAGLGGNDTGAVTLITSGSVRLYVSGSGNVGIGTSTPITTLDISGSIRIVTTPSAGNVVRPDNVGAAFQFGNGTNTAYGEFRFKNTGGTDIGRLLENGNFGIGLTTPSASLHISGASSANLLRIDSPASSSILFVTGSGRVGIGTTAPTVALQIGDTTSGTGNYIKVLGNNSDSTYDVFVGARRYPRFTLEDTTVGGSAFQMWSLGNTMRFGTNTGTTETSAWYTKAGNAADVIFNGKVGIGTTTPTALLHISASNSSSAYSFLVQNSLGQVLFSSQNDRTVNINSTNATNGNTTIGTTNGTITFNQGYNNTFVGNALTFYNGGVASTIQGFATNPGIAVGYAQTTTNPNTGSVFTVKGTSASSGSGVLFVTGSSATRLLRVASETNADILTVSGSGNVGIGTSTPAFKFDTLGSATSGVSIVGQFIGGTGTSAGGLRLGAYSAAYGGFWSANVTPTTSNYALISSGADTGLNSTNTINFYINNNSVSSVTSTGLGIGTTSPSSRLQVRGSGATSATTNFILQNSTPTNLMTVLDNGQVAFTTPTISLATSQSAFSIAPIISASNTIGGQYYGVNITPTFFSTTSSQTETALRVAATFTGSAVATAGTNIIADFGATSVGSQFTVTDVTSGSIYMVNDVSGLPIIEATSAWDVNMYNFPNLVFQKTGTQVNIFGTLRVSGSFILPLSQSISPQTGSAYWSGSLLFVYDGIRYRSSSFA